VDETAITKEQRAGIKEQRKRGTFLTLLIALCSLLIPKLDG
jgi:hypothetical protein